MSTRSGEQARLATRAADRGGIGSAPRSRTTRERAALAAEIVSAYVHARYLLRREPILAAVERLRAHSPVPTEPSERSLEEAARLGQVVLRTLALLPGDTRCLVRSLVLTRLLARRGIAAKLVIGVRPGEDFLAHAWVEHTDSPVLSPGDGTYGRLVEL